MHADDLEESGCSACDDTDGESGPRRKLTRAQRKRLRKKKLKEDASRRGNIIGPLLPSEGEAGDVETEPPDVRRNAAEKKFDATADNSGEETACANQNKLKQRRMAKRLAKERLKPSNLQNCSQNHQHCADDEDVGSK
ncbi:hypothetical protein FH972_004764 [Carpinus fangiana]|uniref:Uncharacterized protein n=1 Tax=Carpinus fangiana TaxID=176857 RepID=A0A5N6QMI9_9ROSI|nr:hypothetical protein FH972_004764 [Carpinus fangiana]